MKKVITYGTFDLLTPGHIKVLKESREMGDYLIVGLSTDEFNHIKNKKSYLSYEERKIIIESIKYVDEVIPENDWEQKISDIKRNNVSVLTMGSDWEGSDKFNYLKEYCQVKFVSRDNDKWASTNFRTYQNRHRNDKSIINKIKSFCKVVLIKLFKIYLKVVYFFIKLLPYKNNQIFLLSRQSDKVNLSYEMITKKLPKNIKVKIECYKIKNKISSYLLYALKMHKQMYFLATSKVVLIDGYNPVVSILNHKKSTTVIQLWHALSAIKKFGYQSLKNDFGRDELLSEMLEMHKNYDYVISGSDAMNKYFAEAFNVEENKILSIGTPVIDCMLQPLNIKYIPKEYLYLKDKPIIVYLPTFRKGRANEYTELLESIDLNKYNVVVLSHPESKDVKVDIPGVIYNPNIYFYDLLKYCDYFITDYSAAAMEVVIANKKLIFYVYDYDLYEKENGININLFEEFKYTTKKAKDVVKWIDDENYDKKVVEKFKRKYVTNLKGDSTKKICDLIKEKL